MTTPSTASRTRSRLSAWSAEELQPSLLVTSLLSGGLIYVLEVVFAAPLPAGTTASLTWDSTRRFATR